MKVGQACTYRDVDGREFSAKIEAVGETPVFDKDTGESKGKTQLFCTIVYKQSRKERRAELVPENQISDIHDLVQEEVLTELEKTLEEVESIDKITTLTDEDDDD